MSRITIKIAEKQLSGKNFKLHKGFKIKDNETVVLYNLKPFVTKKFVQFASVTAVDRTKTELLISAARCSWLHELHMMSNELFRKSFLFFHDPYKRKKLVWRPVPYGIKNIPEAFEWIAN